MKLASYTESDQARKLTELLIKRGRQINFVLFSFGLLAYLILLRPEYVRYRFFDENALLTGLVKREYVNSGHLSKLTKQYRNIPWPNSHDWMESELKGSGFEVYHQYYSVQDPTGGPSINGSNLYGILRAGRSSSTESLVLLAPDNIRNDYNYGIVVLLGLAKYLSTRNYWAKDIIILITGNDTLGAQAWLDSYLGFHTPGIWREPLSGRAGAIQAVVNIEVALSEGISFVNVIPEGVNAILPNLDLVFVASRLCELEGINAGFHRKPDFSDQHSSSLLTAVAVLSHQATGLPFNNHALFLKHRIDSLTLQILPENNYFPSGRGLLSVARSLEGILRSLNNLLERLHHSEFFYFMSSPITFLSIGQYSPFFGLLVAPLILESIRQWVLRNAENVEASRVCKELGIPPLLNIPLKHFLSLLFASLLSGSLLYYFPSFLLFLSIKLSLLNLTISLLSLIIVMTLSAVIIRPTFTELEHHVTCSLILFVTAIGLYGLSLMHFALSLYLTLLFSLPLSLSTSHSTVSKLLLLLCSPPLLVLYSCLFHLYLFSSTSQPIEDALTMAMEGLTLAYRSHFISGAWLYPMVTFFVFPSWWMCWIVATGKIKKAADPVKKKQHSD
ncbi:PREDICTED: glycosylphosphatidylinositol anchor attachment 1 protein-like [Amphimedon queenslandica]|uniref:Glycosylphosphatidylinositol anchor attachment 1 protein n=1 Tax=Amphimedon queenslandica TaxID=400682 RepID=A0A1X7VV59_AMPQE|nr:PREDICTED: glycosylphosphatidylinositol anchor attachment 1 protein-like [Amphimedon queenslandica]|eukprot:XP_011402542.1 PREDICTED: glycosylphosphatidylinositol anchor attachment 1 protein-like [Amphimedon queenslandica]